MIDHVPEITVLINNFLAWVLGLFNVHVEEGHPVIQPHILLAIIATIFIVLLFKLTVKNLSIFPEKGQVLAEGIYKAFRSLLEDMIGHEGRKFVPVLGTLGLFIAVSNIMGLVSGLGSPTANINVPLACTLFVMLYYHFQGMKKHGVIKYLKNNFMGPVWWLAPLFIPIEIIAHFLARPLSLTMRLFGNIFGEDLVIIIIASLVPYIAPLPIMALATLTSLLQAFIFVMLSSIYLAGAMAEEH